MASGDSTVDSIAASSFKENFPNHAPKNARDNYMVKGFFLGMIFPNEKKMYKECASEETLIVIEGKQAYCTKISNDSLSRNGPKTNT